MAGAQLGPAYDLAARLARIEAQLAALSGQPVLQNAAAYQSDGTAGLWISLAQSGGTQTVWFYGPGTPGVTPTNGQWPVFVTVGQVTSGGTAAGVGLVGWRPDGTESFLVGNKGASLIDHAGNPVFTESSTAGWGLYAPQIPLPTPVPASLTMWPSSNSTAWTTIATSNCTVQQGKVSTTGYCYAPSGVSGNVRVTFDGTTLATWTVSNNNFTPLNSTSSIPAGSASWQHGSVITLDVQVTGGTGAISAQLYGVMGVGA